MFRISDRFQPVVLDCSLKRIGLIFRTLVASISFLILLGWILDVPSLVVLVPDSAPMAMCTAFCFLIASIIPPDSEHRAGRRIVDLAGACLVTALSLCMLCNYAGWIPDVVDRYLVPLITPAAAIRYPIRMSLITAIGFTFLGTGSLAAACLRGEARVAVMDAAHAAMLVLGLGSAIGHLYTIPFLRAFGFEKIISTASTVSFMLLGAAGFLSRSGEGCMAVVCSRRTGGRIARRFLLIILLIPVLLGGSIAVLMRRGVLDPSQAILMVVMGTIVFFSGFLIRNAATIDRTESACLRSEERYRELFRNISGGVAVFATTPDGGFTLIDMNVSAARMRRARSGDLIGLRLEESFPCMTSNGILQAMGEVRATGTSRCVPEVHCECMPEMNCEARDSDVWRTYFLYALPGREVVVVWDDVTARRKAELEKARLEAELVQSQKMEALGRLAGGVAHDFNNILMVIKGYGEMVLAGSDGPLRDQVREIRNAADRAAELTEQLLLFSRKRTREPEAVDVGECVSRSERMLRRIIGEDIELSISVERNAGRAFVDPGSIEQVVMNLAANARDAMPSGGRLAITVKNPSALGGPSENGDGWVEIDVSDTGVGMDESIRTRAFEPFFTTKPSGKGTGLGLSIVYGIVTRNGGRISLSSAPGRGTMFHIELPKAAKPEPHAGAGRPAETVPPVGEATVLLVEDEASTRRYVRDALRSRGYEVLEAVGGAEALRLWKDRGGHVQLIVTDVVMPRMGGEELADIVHRAAPTMPFLFMSGYPQSFLSRRDAFRDSTVRFIQKPFDADSLVLAVRECIASRPVAAAAMGGGR